MRPNFTPLAALKADKIVRSQPTLEPTKGQAGVPKGPMDAQVVSARRVREELQSWRAKYEVDRPVEMSHRWRLGEQSYTASNEPVETINLVTAWHWLAQESKVGIDTIRKIVNGHRGAWLDLATADKLLTAIGKSDLLDNHTIQIRKNPFWSQEKYQAWRESQGCF